MRGTNLLRNESGFTLIEIVAVLVILGVLAAVAIPKYLDLQSDAKQKAAMGEVAEIKGTLNSAWGKYLLSASTAPGNVADVYAAASLTTGATTIGSAPDDWKVTLGSYSTTSAKIEVTGRGTDTGYSATGTWNLPNA